MRFFQLSTFGMRGVSNRCFITSPPDGMGIHMYRMGLGDRAAAHFPNPARISLREEDPGIALTSLLGNGLSYLIVSSALKDAILGVCEGVEIESLPFDLYDHRGRLYSADYHILNPIGSRDCLDQGASEIMGRGAFVLVKRMVLSGEKLEGAPSLFRVDVSPTEYIVDERLALAMQGSGITNVVLSELEVTGR